MSQISVHFNSDMAQKILRDKEFCARVERALVEHCGFAEDMAAQLDKILSTHQLDIISNYLKPIAVGKGSLAALADSLDCTWSRLIMSPSEIRYITSEGQYKCDLDSETAEGIFQKCEGSLFNAKHHPTPDEVINAYDAGISVAMQE